SKVAGWFVPARGTCSRKLSSPSASIRQTRTPACANASDRQSPTGPAPTTITRLEASMLAVKPQEVIPGHTESADRWLACEANMRPERVVAVERSGQRGISLL